jgi:hypothetical protein
MVKIAPKSEGTFVSYARELKQFTVETGGDRYSVDIGHLAQQAHKDVVGPDFGVGVYSTSRP